MPYYHKTGKNVIMYFQSTNDAQGSLTAADIRPLSPSPLFPYNLQKSGCWKSSPKFVHPLQKKKFAFAPTFVAVTG
jgi:hypothetical protein